MRSGDHGLGQKSRILDSGRKDEVLIAVAFSDDVVIFRQLRAGAIWDAIATKVAGPKIRGCYLQRTCRCSATIPSDRKTESRPQKLPFRFRYALQVCAAG